MKKAAAILGLSVFLAVFFSSSVFSQDVIVSKRCPVCGKEWDGNYRLCSNIPLALPKPKEQEWLNKFSEALILESQAKGQYLADRDKFKIFNFPYGMIIPQDEDHIRWLNKLFTAYGITPEVKPVKIKEHKALGEAYSDAIKIEAQIIRLYEWLVLKAENQYSRWVLNTMLLQARLQQAMFTHAYKMKATEK